jgi:tripartite-type tricarboxylate transporter receptor subunit TctC
MWRLCLLLAACLLGSPARAQDYPSKPVRFVLATAPGGLTDLLGRVTAEHLGKALRQSFIPDNRPGGAGIIGVGFVAKAAPDGYTLLVCETGRITTNPWLYKSLPYDSMRDFTPVSSIATAPTLVFVNAKLPASGLRELIDYAKKRPGELSYSSSGLGSVAHFAGDRFSRLAGIDMLHVPYKGMASAVADVMAGRVQLTFVTYGVAAAGQKSGQLRALAVSGQRRIEALPDLPTFEEAGVSGYDVSGSFGLFAPRGTPAAIVNLLNQHVGAMLDDADFKARFREQGFVTARQTPAQFAAQIRADYERWGEIVGAAGITLQ